jgi:hypothetical protein
MRDLFENMEDAENAQGVANPAKVLTDSDLEDGGLRQVRAFVRTKASKNALRVKKHRDKAEAEGLQQVNVIAPEEARAVVKQIAKRTASGEPLGHVLQEIAGYAPKVYTPDTDPLAAKIIAAARSQGLRGWLIRKLARVS